MSVPSVAPETDPVHIQLGLKYTKSSTISEIIFNFKGLRYFSPVLKIKQSFVRFEVFTAVTMKNGVFLDVTPCGSCKNRRFGGT
jgi:hypothetical protein